MEQLLFSGIIFGALGGLIRSLVHLLHILNKRFVEHWRTWLVKLLITCFVGMVAGSIFSEDSQFSIVAGYSGVEIFDGLYKSFRKNQNNKKY